MDLDSRRKSRLILRGSVISGRMSPEMTDFHVIPAAVAAGILRGFPSWKVFLRRPRQCLGRRVFCSLSALLAQRLGLLLQEALEPRTGGRVIQGEVDGGLQEAAEVASVIPAALKVHGHHAASPAQLRRPSVS